MNLEEQLVSAHKAWEATKFLGEKEKQEYDRLNELSIQAYKKQLELIKQFSDCNDDPDCLNCGS